MTDLEGHVASSPGDSTIALAIPAYNEADGIAGFLRDLDAVLATTTAGHHFVIVNDRSTDTTLEVLAALEPELGGSLIVETNDVNSGHGPTVLRAYRRALDTGAGWILQVDGDGQFEADDVPLLFDAAAAGAAIVTGARTVRFDPWYRRAITATLPLALRAAFGVRRRDINCPLRLYRRDVLEAILADVPADSLTPHVLMTVLEHRADAHHVEMAVQHRPRRGDSEVGTTWGNARRLLIPRKLIVFVAGAAGQLVGFARSQRR